MNNTRFATAIHILTILALEEGLVSSDYIAGSININPVIVRKDLSVLKEAGLVDCKKGKEGGCRLNKKSNEILISDIYGAVKNIETLGKKNQDLNPKCPIGKNINSKLNILFNETDQYLLNFLSHKTLEDFIKQF